jgi:hypothetical protein
MHELCVCPLLFIRRIIILYNSFLIKFVRHSWRDFKVALFFKLMAILKF